MKRTVRQAVIGLALALASTSALAAVVFDVNTGVGSVGKGDVQEAFGWNDAALQASAGGVTFTYGFTAVYAAVCTWTTGEGTRGEKTHNVAHSQEMDVSSAINVALRRNPQSKVTGFSLTGYGDSFSESGTVPVVGGPCPGNQGHGGVWSSVTLLAGSEGGLYVNYGDQKVLLPL
ncbi:hypothetical protein [Aerolutibacter ruishenii]|uniref:Secreted protein n=1 Tax=Aerolutibacter ruishenii TaxID=686800 RepID=A0A562LWU3_9GAMM|nr:hypothetical protein [Lysobacter ruishenii]TWI12076.1 hypothetical protein IP93_01357 [Lysobacter ruishenii]